ncbi:MAG: methyltransferase domain-containing protein [Chloroflexi bacterium]|nr:methyltransferase domain-containing protein [Chloroflexota bacterium]MDA0242614.1 methyltransferase domain-containing protein [Chloroflexota bacterium]
MSSILCNLCGRDEYTVRYPATLSAAETPDARAFRCTSAGYGHHAQIVQCNHCGYVYANPRWDSDELMAMYGAVEDETYVQERVGRRLTFERHLQHFERFAGAGDGRTLLDVGAYIGVFVEVAREAGWQALGVEPSAWATAEAQRHGLNVIEGTQDAPQLAGQQFDALTMWDVIEHVADPSAELKKAHALLKPGGFIAVHTMNVDSLMAKLMGGRWPWYMAMHIHYFSKRTLSEMMRRNGFEIVWVGVRGRYLRLNYLVSRLGGLSPRLGRLARRVVDGLGVADKAVPVNFGDLFTVYGRKRGN